MKAIEAPKPREIMHSGGTVKTGEWFCYGCNSSDFISGTGRREYAVKHALKSGHTVAFREVYTELIFPLETQ